MSYSSEIAQAIQQFLTEDGWHFTFDEEKGRFKFNLKLDTKLQGLNYYVFVRESDYTVYAGIALNASDCKAEMAEFITRANYGLFNGNFEMDYRDGEIRYKCYVECEDQIPSQAVVRESIYVPGKLFTHYGDGLLAVMFGMQTPEEAIEAIEKE